MSNQPTPEPQPFLATVRVEWNIPLDVKSRYATLFSAQATKHEVTLSFFEPQIPVFAGTPEEIAAQTAELTAVRADCVSRVILAAEQVPELIAVLENSLKAYRAIQAAQGAQPGSKGQSESKGA